MDRPAAGRRRPEVDRDPATGRTCLTAGPQDEQEAAAKGYSFIRIEGYALPAT